MRTPSFLRAAKKYTLPCIVAWLRILRCRSILDTSKRQQLNLWDSQERLRENSSSQWRAILTPRNTSRPMSFVRVVVDLLNVRGQTALIIDYKTGKPKPGFTQLELSAAVLSTHLPEIETFKMAYVWLADRKVSPHTLHKADLVGVWNNFLPRVAKIEAGPQD